LIFAFSLLALILATIPHSLNIKQQKSKGKKTDKKVLLPDTFKPTTDRHGMTRILDVDWD